MAYKAVWRIITRRRYSGSNRSPRPLWNTDKDATIPWHDGKENGRKVHSEIVAKNAIIGLG